MDNYDAIYEEVSFTRALLVSKFPFFGYIALSSDIVVTESVPTAGVNGIKLAVNPKFFFGLDESTRIFIVAHEVLHLALRHVSRRKWRDIAKWNVAADFIVNEMLFGHNFPPPSEDMEIVTRDTIKKTFGIDLPDIDNVSAEGIYELLPEIELTCTIYMPDLSDGFGDGEDEDDEKSGEGNGQSVEEVEDRWKQVLRSAIASADKRIGNIPAWLKRDIDILPPVLDWRTLLSNFVASARDERRSFRRPSRRHLWRGSIMSDKSLGKMTLVVAVDVSGSINVDEFSAFMAEVGSISRSSNTKVVVVACDTRITHEEVLEHGEMPSFNIHGGGGTAFEPIFDYVTDKPFIPDGVIILTDGYGSYPDSQMYPTLWVLTKDHKEPPWGWKAYMENV